MKTLRNVCAVFAISMCRFAHSQTASDLQVLQATYGAQSRQIDVTEKVKSILAADEPIDVSNKLVGGTDPAFGEVKTLTVVYIENGQQKTNSAKEGETLVYSPPSEPGADREQPSNTTAPPAAPHIPATLAAPAPELAPEGTYFLTAPTSVSNKKTGVIVGLHAGTAIEALRDDGATIHAKWETFEFDVDKRMLTNDVGVARAAANANYQAEVGSVNAFNNAQQQEVSRQIEAKQRTVAEKHRNLPPEHTITRGSKPIDINDTDEARKFRERSDQRMQERNLIRSQVETLGILRGNHTPLTPQEHRLQNQIDRLNKQLSQP